MKKRFLIILFVLWFSNTFAQNSELDSLKNIFQNSSSDSIKIETLFQIGLLYENTTPNDALNYYRQALHLAIKNKNKHYEAEAIFNIAIIHDITEKYTIALQLYHKSLSMYESIQDTSKMGYLNMNIGGVYMNRHMLDSALIFTLYALKYFEVIEDTSGIKSIYTTLASISIENNNFQQALEYLKDIDKISNYDQEPDLACVVFNNYGLIYQKLDLYNKSFKYLQDALKIAINNNLNIFLPAIYINLGKTFQLNSELNQAIIYYYKAKSACEDINDPIALVEVYAGLAQVYRKKGFQKTALGFLLLAKNIIELNDNNVPLSSQIGIYKDLSVIYHNIGDDVIAYKYLNIKDLLNDSLIKIENFRITKEIESKYQIGKKISEIEDLTTQNINTQQELEKTDAEKRAQKRALITLIILISLILFTSIWILKNYIENKKLNKELEIKNKKILETQSKVERIVNFLPEVFFETDTNGRIIYTNKNFFDATGYNTEDLRKGLNFTDFFNKKQKEKVKETINNLNKNKPQHSIELEFVKKDGSSFPAILSLNKKNSDKQNFNFYGVVIDISEKKKTEQELLLLKTSVEQTDISVMITNNKGSIVYVNPAFERTTGYNYNEATNNTPRIINSGETPKEVYKEFWKTVLNGKVWRGNFKNKRKNGELFWEKNIVSPLKDSSGKITHYIANKEDITQEVENNEKIYKLFTATENSPNSVIILDANKNITYVNSAFEKITGYKSDEIIGANLSFLNSNEHDEDFYKNIWYKIQNENLWQGTLINKRKNGELYWDATTILKLENEDQETIGYVCNDIDITYQIKTQEKLKNTLNELNEKNEEIYSSLKYAQRIQNSLIPEEEQVLNLFPASFTLFLPRDIVSGDFYWIHENKNDKFIAVVDCTGHSVPGAFLSIIGFNFLEASVKEAKVQTPAEILDFVGTRLKAIFSKTSKRSIQDDMEVNIISLSNHSKKVTYASSRNRLYLVRDIINTEVYEDFFTLVTVNSSRKMLKINGDRQFLAKKKENFNYQDFTFNFYKNDIIYLSTDGYYDQFGDKDDSKFKRVNFEKLLLNVSENKTSEQKEILLYKLLKWKGETPQTDDITVIGIKLS